MPSASEILDPSLPIPEGLKVVKVTKHFKRLPNGEKAYVRLMSATVQWQPVKGLERSDYRLEFSKNGSKYVLAYMGPDHKTIVRRLSPGNRYIMRVKTVSLSASSKWSAAVGVRIPAGDENNNGKGGGTARGEVPDSSSVVDDVSEASWDASSMYSDTHSIASSRSLLQRQGSGMLSLSNSDNAISSFFKQQLKQQQLEQLEQEQKQKQQQQVLDQHAAQQAAMQQQQAAEQELQRQQHNALLLQQQEMAAQSSRANTSHGTPQLQPNVSVDSSQSPPGHLNALMPAPGHSPVIGHTSAITMPVTGDSPPMPVKINGYSHTDGQSQSARNGAPPNIPDSAREYGRNAQQLHQLQTLIAQENMSADNVYNRDTGRGIGASTSRPYSGANVNHPELAGQATVIPPQAQVNQVQETANFWLKSDVQEMAQHLLLNQESELSQLLEAQRQEQIAMEAKIQEFVRSVDHRRAEREATQSARQANVPDSSAQSEDRDQRGQAEPHSGVNDSVIETFAVPELAPIEQQQLPTSSAPGGAQLYTTQASATASAAKLQQQQLQLSMSAEPMYNTGPSIAAAQLQQPPSSFYESRNTQAVEARPSEAYSGAQASGPQQSASPPRHAEYLSAGPSKKEGVKPVTSVPVAGSPGSWWNSRLEQARARQQEEQTVQRITQSPPPGMHLAYSNQQAAGAPATSRDTDQMERERLAKLSFTPRLARLKEQNMGDPSPTFVRSSRPRTARGTPNELTLDSAASRGLNSGANAGSVAQHAGQSSRGSPLSPTFRGMSSAPREPRFSSSPTDASGLLNPAHETLHQGQKSTSPAGNRLAAANDAMSAAALAAALSPVRGRKQKPDALSDLEAMAQRVSRWCDSVEQEGGGAGWMGAELAEQLIADGPPAAASHSASQAHSLAKGPQVAQCGVGLVLTMAKHPLHHGPTSRYPADALTVHSIVSGGAAELSGTVGVGDVLVAINGRSIEGLNSKSIRSLLLGPAGSFVTLLFLTRASGHSRTSSVPLTRRPISDTNDNDHAEDSVVVIRDGYDSSRDAVSLDRNQQENLHGANGSDMPAPSDGYGICGIGVVLVSRQGKLVVTGVTSGGPAEQSGQIQIGDTVSGVDGVSVVGYSISQIRPLMLGPAESVVSLCLERPAELGYQCVLLSLVREMPKQ